MNGSEMNLEELRDHAMDVNTKMQTNVVEMVKNRKNLNDQVKELLDGDDKEKYNKALIIKTMANDEWIQSTLEHSTQVMSYMDHMIRANKIDIVRNKREEEIHELKTKEQEARIINIEAKEEMDEKQKIFYEKLQDETCRASHRLYIKTNIKMNKHNALKVVIGIFKQLLANRGQRNIPKLLSADLRYNHGKVAGVSVQFADKNEREAIAKLSVDIPHVFDSNRGKISFTDEIPTQFLKAYKVFQKLESDIKEMYDGKTKIRMDYSTKRLILLHGESDSSMNNSHISHPMKEVFTYKPHYVDPEKLVQISEYEEVRPYITPLDTSDISDLSRSIILRKAYPEDPEADNMTMDYVKNMISANLPSELMDKIVKQETLKKDSFCIKFVSNKDAKDFFNYIKDTVFSYLKIIGSLMGDVTDSKIDYEKRSSDKREAIAKRAGEEAAKKAREEASKNFIGAFQQGKQTPTPGNSSNTSFNSVMSQSTSSQQQQRKSNKRKADENEELYNTSSSKRQATNEKDKSVRFDSSSMDSDYIDITESSRDFNDVSMMSDNFNEERSFQSYENDHNGEKNPKGYNRGGNYRGSNRGQHRGRGRGRGFFNNRGRARNNQRGRGYNPNSWNKRNYHRSEGVEMHDSIDSSRTSTPFPQDHNSRSSYNDDNSYNKDFDRFEERNNRMSNGSRNRPANHQSFNRDPKQYYQKSRDEERNTNTNMYNNYNMFRNRQ